MKNILVAVDFDDNTRPLIDQAIALAEKFEAKVWLIHIAEPNPDFVGFDEGPQYIRNSKAEELREEHRMVQAQTEKFTDRGIDAEGLLVQGATDEMILEETEKLNIDLVILGHYKQGLLYRTFVESTGTVVINESKVPVLIVPLDEENES